MDPQEPQIIDLDPDKAPRTTAFILLACGLLGVAFLLINMVFTGDDQYYIKSEWEDGTEPVNQRFDIMPNLVRGRQVGDDSEEDEEAQDVPTLKRLKPTTAPLTPYQQLLNRMGLPPNAGNPTATPTVPGSTPAIGASPSGTAAGAGRTGAGAAAPPSGK